MVQGEFRAGEALSKGFAIWFKNLPAFLVLTVLVYSPIIVYTLLIIGGEMSQETFTRWSWTTSLLKTPLSMVVTAAVLYGTIEQLRGRHAGIGEAIGVGIRRLLPVLGVGFLSGLAAAVGCLLLVVPGIIIFCMLYVAVPVAVIERPRVFGALARSRELTRGHKWPIFGILMVFFLINIVVGLMLSDSFLSTTSTISDFKKFAWLRVGADVPLVALGATINGVVYHDLRVAKEGIQTEDLSLVFR